MKILFITLHVRRSPQATPLAAGCLMASLSQERHSDCTLLDFFPEDSEETILTAIRTQQPDIIVESIYLWNRKRITSLNRRLRDENPAMIIIGGGPEATGNPNGTLQGCSLSMVVCGAGETVFPQLITALENELPFESIPGITFPDGSQIHHTPEPPSRPDALVSPWLSNILTPEVGGGVLWEVARGCPFSCDFCFDAGGVRGVQSLPFERLEQEWQLFRETGITQLWVLDSTFNVPPERGKKLLKMLLQQPADIHLHFEAKAEHLDHEIVELLTQLPCSVQVGLQSTHSEVLRDMHRPFDFENFSAGVKLLNDAGITFGIDLIYGLPGDSYTGFKESLNRVIPLRPNHLDLFPLAVLPGTTLAKQRDQYGLNAPLAPPYTLIESDDFSADDIAACDQLATAASLFYSTGRAVGFMTSILTVCEQSPSNFFTGFHQWLTTEQNISAMQFATAETWSSAKVLSLQQGYLAFTCIRLGKKQLKPVIEDLINDHYHGAETLIGPETFPPDAVDLTNTWTRLWRTVETIRLVDFHYEIGDLQEFGENDLRKFIKHAQPTGSTALYMRRGGELVCESLSDEFALLLKKSDGSCTPKEILAGGMSQDEGEELVEFAVAEGLLKE